MLTLAPPGPPRRLHRLVQHDHRRRLRPRRNRRWLPRRCPSKASDCLSAASSSAASTWGRSPASSSWASRPSPCARSRRDASGPSPYSSRSSPPAGRVPQLRVPRPRSRATRAIPAWARALRRIDRDEGRARDPRGDRASRRPPRRRVRRGSRARPWAGSARAGPSTSSRADFPTPRAR